MKYLTGLISLVILVFAGHVHHSYAQCNLTLRGIVRDADTREPLGYSNVVILETQTGSATDERGRYVIDDLCPGTYTVLVSHLSCESKELVITINSNTVQNFELPHRHNELLEICIIDEKHRQTSTVAFQELSGKELDKTRGESLAQSLSQLPGVSALRSGSSVAKPVIHGLHSNRVLILNNGIRQEGQQWGSEHAPEIDPFIAKRITVIKGARSVRYGSDAVAGVILVEPDELPVVPGISGEVNLVGFSNNREGVASAIIEQNFAKLKPLSWRLQGTLKQGGNIKTPGYYLKNTGYREQNFSVASGWNKPLYGAEIFYSQFNNEIGMFSGAHIGNLTDLEEAFTRPEPLEQSGFSYKIERPSQNVEHELTKVKAWLLTGNSGKLSSTYARQYNLRFEYDKDRPLNDSLAALNKPELSYEITTHSLDLLWEHNNILGLVGMIGVSGVYQANTFEGRMFIPNYENTTAGVFWIERWRKNKLQLEAGARYDVKKLEVFMFKSGEVISTQFNYEQLSGTAGVIYDITPHAQFSFNTGSAWRPPGVNELYSNGLHHGAAAVEIGDPGLKEERAINLIAAINFHDHKKYRAEVAVYYNYINDFIYLQPVRPPTLTIRGAFPTFYYRQATAAISGIDALVEYNLSRMFSANAKIAVVRAFNRDTEEYLPLMPADNVDVGIKWKMPAKSSIRDLYVGVNVKQVLKQTRVPDESDYLPPPRGYTLLNFETGCEVLFGKYPVMFTVGVANLLNEKHRDYMNRYRYFADEQGRNVSLKIKVPFRMNKVTK